MYARRHPFLFFMMIISICFTILFLGFMGLIAFGSKLVNTQFVQHYTSTEGNIGIVEVTGMILSYYPPKRSSRTLRPFRKMIKLKQSSCESIPLEAVSGLLRKYIGKS